MSQSSDLQSKKVAATTVSDRKILRRIRVAGVRVFVDELNGPSVILPVTSGRRRWPVDSDRTKAWIARFVHRNLRVPIEAAQLKRVMLVLKGDAYLGPHEKGDPDRAWEEIEHEPVLRALLAFVDADATKKHWEGLTSKLLTKLTAKAAAIGIWTDSKEWPAITQLLTFKLNKKSKVLKAVGVQYRHSHRRNGSWSSLAWGDEFCNCLSMGGDAGDAGDAPERTLIQSTDVDDSCGGDAGDAGDDAAMRHRLQNYERQLAAGMNRAPPCA